eukprot:CAMPEP_0168468074 /NCGR_PEP_ID=MMETSP0228-20121227/57517_1 /TAXON_ID=133427 /ORGANISM="Protoceratium reticulatum, Strain CCCM 535 (=CCMP 1889)" /LENGTH=70 /DNA_ID=CAMNT_0008483817 /DNA_START=355 /DNA_END=564 /DNA_ORIENTATION=+
MTHGVGILMLGVQAAVLEGGHETPAPLLDIGMPLRAVGAVASLPRRPEQPRPRTNLRLRPPRRLVLRVAP